MNIITEHTYNANQIVVYHNNRLPPPPNPQQQQQPRRGRPPQYEIVRGIGQNVEGIRVDIAAIPAEVADGSLADIVPSTTIPTAPIHPAEATATVTDGGKLN